MNLKQQRGSALSICAAIVVWSSVAVAQEDTDLVRDTENPLAKRITVPVQSNWDFGIGPHKAMKYTVKLEPIIPFALGTNWYVLSRTILPFAYAEPAAPGDPVKSGLEDTSLSLFLTPRLLPVTTTVRP